MRPRLPRPPTSCASAIPSAQAFPFIPYEVGVRKGFFTNNGLDVERVDLSGGAQLHQAMKPPTPLDIRARRRAPDLAFVAKGAPEIGVAAMAGDPLFLGIIVGYDLPIKTVDDLKGKRIGVPNGAHCWYAGWTKKMIQNKGWAPDAVDANFGRRRLAVGDCTAGLASDRRGRDPAAALGFSKLETTKQGRLLTSTADFAPNFLQHVIFASTQDRRRSSWATCALFSKAGSRASLPS